MYLDALPFVTQNLNALKRRIKPPNLIPCIDERARLSTSLKTSCLGLNHLHIPTFIPKLRMRIVFRRWAFRLEKLCIKSAAHFGQLQVPNERPRRSIDTCPRGSRVSTSWTHLFSFILTLIACPNVLARASLSCANNCSARNQRLATARDHASINLSLLAAAYTSLRPVMDVAGHPAF